MTTDCLIHSPAHGGGGGLTLLSVGHVTFLKWSSRWLSEILCESPERALGGTASPALDNTAPRTQCHEPRDTPAPWQCHTRAHWQCDKPGVTILMNKVFIDCDCPQPSLGQRRTPGRGQRGTSEWRQSHTAAPPPLGTASRCESVTGE